MPKISHARAKGLQSKITTNEEAGAALVGVGMVSFITGLVLALIGGEAKTRDAGRKVKVNVGMGPGGSGGGIGVSDNF